MRLCYQCLVITVRIGLIWEGNVFSRESLPLEAPPMMPCGMGPFPPHLFRSRRTGPSTTSSLVQTPLYRDPTYTDFTVQPPPSNCIMGNNVIIGKTRTLYPRLECILVNYGSENNPSERLNRNLRTVSFFYWIMTHKTQNWNLSVNMSSWNLTRDLAGDIKIRKSSFINWRFYLSFELRHHPLHLPQLFLFPRVLDLHKVLVELVEERLLFVELLLNSGWTLRQLERPAGPKPRLHRRNVPTRTYSFRLKNYIL